MNVKTIRMMLSLKGRRVKEAEQEVPPATAALSRARTALEDSERTVQRCRQDEARRQARIDALIDSPSFDPAQLLVNRTVLDALVATTAKAMTDCEAAATSCRQAEEALAALKRRVQQLRQQMDRLEERRVRTLRALEEEIEDKQDEESEEAAVARLVAKSRAKACGAGE